MLRTDYLALAWSERRKLQEHTVLEFLAGTREGCELVETGAIRRVGRWLWCEFATKPDSRYLTPLKEAGFTWSKNRSAWQHPCGGLVAKPATTYDPRDRYGEEEIRLPRRFVEAA